MKRFIFLLSFLIAVISFGCNSNDTSSQAKSADKDSANFTTIKWIDSTVDLGSIPIGEKRNFSFTFQNSGDKPLYLTSVEPTCGCTIANYTKSAVMPGEKGVVDAVFNSNNHPGEFRKGIRVKGNTKNVNVSVLVFTGNVIDSTNNNSNKK